MDSRELVRRAIEFQGPSRIPLRYSFDPGRSDIVGIGYHPAKGWTPWVPGEDEFGCVWDTLEGRVISSFGQVKDSPIKSWDEYENYRFPDPHAEGRFEGLAKAIEHHRSKGKYIVGSMGFHGFNRMMFLRGAENLLMDLVLNHGMVKKLADDLMQWEMAIISDYLELGVDGVWFGDDWGTQRGLFISPSLWREIFKPLYKAQFDLIHQHGKHVLFHSCGYVWDIIGDFIEIGVNALNLNQPNIFGNENVSGIDRLAENFGGKVCFICPVDMQTTLIAGTEEDIRKEAKHLVSALGRYNGGFIACCDEGIDHGYIPIKRIRLMGKAFEEFAWPDYQVKVWRPRSIQ
ncbi:MAG: hypothetical protein HPY52_16660 [Firmicutes bacterium]|nr:hypothetical protein [Bacillota bacterium]